MASHHQRILLTLPLHCMNFTRLLQHEVLGLCYLSSNEISAMKGYVAKCSLVKALTGMTGH